MPYDAKMKYCALAPLSNLGFCAGTEDGVLSFWKYMAEKKKFEHTCKWSCQILMNYKIVSMASHELNKEEVYLAVANKS